MKPNVTEQLSALGTCITLVILTGCASPTITTTRLQQDKAPVVPSSVRVFKLGETPKESFEVLGVVAAYSNIRGDKPWAGGALKKLRSEAAAMGADALVDYYGNHLSGMSQTYGWSSALAVRLLKPGEAASPPGRDYLVAIPRARVAANVAEGKKAGKLETLTRELAQYWLAKKGYYAVLVDEPLPSSFESGFAGMNAAEIARYGGEKCDKILGIELVGSSGFNAGLFVGAANTLELATYSKGQRKKEWAGSSLGRMGVGSAIGPNGQGALLPLAGLSDLFVPSAKRIQSIHNALGNAFCDFPSVSTSTRGPGGEMKVR